MKKILMSLGLLTALLGGAISMTAASTACCDPDKCCQGQCDCPCCQK